MTEQQRPDPLHRITAAVRDPRARVVSMSGYTLSKGSGLHKLAIA